MRTYWYIYLLLVIISKTTYSQVDISKYKVVSDRFLASNFSTNVQASCLFTGYYITKPDSSYWYFDSTQLINDRIDSFISTTFNYALFNKALNFDIEFSITIDKRFVIIDTTELFYYVPDCIRVGSDCNLLSKDEAIAIAIKNKILYTVDFRVEFFRAQNSNEFYWLVTGYREKLGKAKSSRRSTMSTQQKRLINAKTGHCITPGLNKIKS